MLITYRDLKIEMMQEWLLGIKQPEIAKEQIKEKSK